MNTNQDITLDENGQPLHWNYIIKIADGAIIDFGECAFEDLTQWQEGFIKTGTEYKIYRRLKGRGSWEKIQ